MINVVVQGKDRRRIFRFVCKECGCVYDATEDEGNYITSTSMSTIEPYITEIGVNETKTLLYIGMESVEGTYGCRVYAAIYNRYEELGDMLTLLTISSDESDWEQERKDLKEMLPIAYVHNFTYPEFSEWGYVVLKVNGNVLERIG